MSAVKRYGGFDNRRCWLITTALPMFRIDRHRWNQTRQTRDRLEEAVLIDLRWSKQQIGRSYGRENLIRGRSVGANKNRRDISTMTALMEVMKVEGVVDDLIDVRERERILSHLELDNEDDWPDDKDGIDPSPHPRNRELQVYRAVL